jgi:mono/diheme cytochrome c family protein
MKFRFTAIFALVSASSALAVENAAGPVTLKDHVKPLLQEYCFDCHNDTKQKGDVNLLPFADNPKLEENRKIWEKVAELIESREMPPEKKPQPNEAQRELLVKYIDGQLSKADCTGPTNPGKVTIRRLNKEEYKNTIRDLMGVQYEPDDFPNDEVGYGFDNIGDVLSLPPMLMEKYLAAADEIVHKAIVLDAPAKPVTKRLRGEQFESGTEWIKAMDNKALGMYREGEANSKAQFPYEGEYTVRIRAYADLAGPELPKLTLGIGGKTLKTFEIGNGGKSANYELKVTLPPGTHRVTLGYLNNYSDANNPDPKLRGDRNIFVEYVEIQTPPGPAPALPDSHKRLITRMPQPGQEREVALEILGRFMPEAYRRPVAAAEVERVAKFVELAQKNGGSFLEGVQAAFQAVLCSPHFLFRWELDPASAQPGVVRELNDYEIASRLSYFLWSTKPDPELSALAAKGELRKPEVLEKQIARMVKDWRIRAFVNNFGGQWLQIRNIWEVDIDRDTFPKWKDNYKGLMKEETERFLEAVIKDDRPVTELLDADYTFLNEELARYYGIEGVKGKDFQRVTLPKDVLTMGSVLVSTSTPTRTSPVIRGKWILEQILGTPPPPPPPNVPPLPEQKQVSQTASVRQRLEQHRAQAECAGCHAKMDPLGFALENFDAAGAWRDQDGKFPIDSTGKLANGTSFSGARDLKQVLKENKKFTHSLAEKMMTYALGRGLEHFDKCAVDAIVAELSKRENRFSALVMGIVTSDPFLKRRPEIAKN